MPSRHEFYSRLSQGFVATRQALGLDVGSFTEKLGMSPARYRRLIWGMAEPTMAEIEALASVSETHIDLFMSGEVDFKTMARHAHSNRTAIPEHYATREHKLARVRAVQVIYEHVRFHRGEPEARRILRRRQCHPEAFRDAASLISPKIVEDLLKDLRQDGLSDEQLRGVGTMTLNVNQGAIARKLAGRATPRALYEYVHEELLQHHYDRINHYRLLKMTDTGCVVGVSTQDEAKEAFRTDTVGTREMCLFRQGVYSSFLANLIPRFAKVEESQCMYSGASHCIVHLSWA
jgi:hypothetical protein